MVSGLTTKAMVLFPQPRGLPTPQPTTLPVHLSRR